MVAQDKHDVQQMAEHTDMAGEGAATGAVTGGVLGGLVGFLVGLSALVLPGIGPIVGALTGQGVPEDDAREYEGRVRMGSILLTVHALSAEEGHHARAIFDGGSVRSYNNSN